MTSTLVTVPLALTVSLAPRTKKNSGQGAIQKSSGIGQPCPHCRQKLRVRVFPSKAWRTWSKLASITTSDGEFHLIGDKPYIRLGSAPACLWVPIDYPVNMAAVFYRDADRGDLVGYVQGICDLLEERGILVNDQLVQGLDGSRLAIDRDNPRTELVLEALA